MIITLPRSRAGRDAERAYDGVLDKIRYNWLVAESTGDSLRRSSVMVVLADLEGRAETLARPVLGTSAEHTHRVCREMLCLIATTERAHSLACWTRASDLRVGGSIWRHGRVRGIAKICDRTDGGKVVYYDNDLGTQCEDLADGDWVQTQEIGVDVLALADVAGVTGQGELGLWEDLAHTANRAAQAEILRELAALPSVYARWGGEATEWLEEHADGVDRVGRGELVDLDDVARQAAAVAVTDGFGIVWVVILFALGLPGFTGWEFWTVALGGFVFGVALRFGFVPFVPGARKGWWK